MNFYDECRGALFHPGGFELTKYAVKYCGFGEDSVIADIGCGAGETSRLLEKEFPVRVLNVEPSIGMSKENPDVINAAAENIPFEDEFLDGVLCECVLSLCETLEPALCELNRIIKPGGSLIISDIYSSESTIKVSGALKWLYMKERFLSAVQDCGFEIALFEDHSRELAKMAARLIMEGAENALCETLGRIDRNRVGYFLIIARKK
jgi:ubiquinone/menaquinone biosynthesis C-methylase UbiE